jgi:hypothetical protein
MGDAMAAMTKVSLPRSLVVSAVSTAIVAGSLAAAPMVRASPQGSPAHGVVGRVTYGQPLSLTLPQSDAFAILGHSCGGIHEHPYVTGFDPATGYPAGAVYLSTTCSAGGRGGHSTTFTAWAGVTWDFTGQVLSSTALSSAPSVDPTFTATDFYEDVIYNTATAAHLLVPYPGAPVSVIAVQSGDEFLVSWTPTLVDPIAIRSTTVTATPVASTAPVLTATVTGAGTNAVIPTLQPSTTYSITVVSATISGAGPGSHPLSVTTSPPTEPPGAPTGVTAVWTNQDPSGPTDTFIVDWNAADPGDSPIDEYLIQAVNSEDGTTYTQTVSGTTLTTYFTEDWVPGWNVSVQAHNAFGWGPMSDVFRLGGL